MENNIEVSILCITYNQKSYIKDALDSFLMQKTNFNYEILVNDDASTDGTTEILKEYEARYPRKLRVCYHEENCYSRGISPTGFIYAMARGKYFAFCEGDDYWTCPDKLQRQYDAMEKHPECDMCAHAANMVKADSKEVISVIDPLGRDGILTMRQVILGGGNYMATNSLFYRRELQDSVKEYQRICHLDYAMQMRGASRGGILYLSENMSSYRRGAENSWTVRMAKNPSIMIEHIKLMFRVLELVDEDTAYQYADAIAEEKSKYEFQLATLQGNGKKVYDKRYRKIRKELPWKNRLVIFLQCYMPWIVKIWKKTKE